MHRQGFTIYSDKCREEILYFVVSMVIYGSFAQIRRHIFVQSFSLFAIAKFGDLW